MSDILIKGMEMPRLGYREIRIHPDGRITENNEGYEETIGTTIPVPPHGRLIDADAMQKEWFNLNFDRKITDGTLAYWNFQLSKIPTIIPTEEGET